MQLLAFLSVFLAINSAISSSKLDLKKNKTKNKSRQLLCFPGEDCSSPRQRISETKCEEYMEKATVYVGGLSLISTEQTVETEKCVGSTGLVVGGEDAKLGEFPHMSALGYRIDEKIKFNCGGSLISELFVLTAAHCETSGRTNPTIVRLGYLNITKKIEGLPESDYRIAQFISHKNYNRYNRKHNDIALVKLQNKVVFSRYIRPACLAQPNTPKASKAIATGWGFLEYAGKKAEILQKVEISIIQNRKCAELLKDHDEIHIDNTQVCAGELEGGKDTCMGDSGGPLQVAHANDNCHYTLIGITSYGVSCGSANSPGIYTKVSEYLDWIEPKVW